MPQFIRFVVMLTALKSSTRLAFPQSPVLSMSDSASKNSASLLTRPPMTTNVPTGTHASFQRSTLVNADAVPTHVRLIESLSIRGENLDPARKVRSNAKERPVRQQTNTADSFAVGGFTQYRETNYVHEHVVVDRRQRSDELRTVRNSLGSVTTFFVSYNAYLHNACCDLNI